MRLRRLRRDRRRADAGLEGGATSLAVHVRMHQAEGAMFPRALADALTDLGLPLVRVPKKDAESQAASDRIATLGKGLGPPWGQDQRQAAAAATIVLDGVAQRK